MPGAPSSFLLLVAMPLLLVASIATSSKARSLVASLLLVVMPGLALGAWTYRVRSI